MPAPLRCPTCSAPVNVPDAHADVVNCTYCGAGVLLTERRGSVEAAPAQDRHADAIAEVLRQLRAGSRIGAVKVYRERFGVGLAEAKHAVERIEAGQPAGSLPPAPAGSPKAALVGAVLVTVSAAAVGVMAARRTVDDAAAPATRIAPGTPARPAAKDAPPAFAEPVLRFGSEGTGAGRFQDARSVAVDGAGRIYVAEYGGGRVQVFDSAGTFLTQWMADPRMPLVDLAADRAGTVYVVQSGRIRRYEGATGRALGEWRPRQSMSSYSDVALALDGTLWAVSGASSVAHLDRDGGVIRRIDLHEAVGEDASATRVAVAGTGEVYVLDRWSGEIYHLAPDGRFVDRFGGRGEGAEAVRSPADVAVDGRGRVYVSDLGAGIRVFDAGGRFLDAFGGPGVIFGIAFNDRDELFAAYRNDHQVVKFSPAR
ncbi:MAG TPA: hypothetical protein VHG08_17010 [Longimicrobium sp.]|nr:hypothetical protein [Longimicrobium sp.]